MNEELLEKLAVDYYQKALKRYHEIEKEDMTYKYAFFQGIFCGLELSQEMTDETTTICD